MVKYTAVLILILIIPGIASAEKLPVPSKPESWSYSMVAFPSVSNDPSQTRPIGFGSVAEGGENLAVKIQLPEFSDSVDIYFAVYAPSIDSDDIYLLRTDYTFQKYRIGMPGQGLAPWKIKTRGPIGESLFGNIPIPMLPDGKYYFAIFVTPSNNLNDYYLWVTSFERGGLRRSLFPYGIDAIPMLIPEVKEEDLQKQKPALENVIPKRSSDIRLQISDILSL